jgi:diguanylate cyclase (GGDEF)-like protein
MGKLLRSRYFRRHFFSFLVLITLIIVGLTALLYFPTRRGLERQQLALVEKYRDEVISSLDKWVRFTRREVEVGALFTSEYISAGTATSPGLTILFEGMVESEDSPFVDLLLTDLEGNLLNSRVHGDEIEPVNLVDRDYVRYGIEGRSTISGFYRSRNSGFPILAVASPVSVRGDTAGVLAGIIRLESLVEAFNEITLDTMGRKYLINGEGYVVSREGFVELYAGEDRRALDEDYQAAKPVAEKIVAGIGETSRYSGMSGTEVFGSYAWFEPLNLGVVVEVRGDMTLRPIYNLMKIILLSGGFFLFVSGVLVYRLTYNFLNPLDRLVTFTHHMVEEGRTEPIDMRTESELDTLIENFNIMNSVIRLRERQLRDMAMRDSLTGLYNHGLLYDLLKREFSRVARSSECISFLMVDIDHFKEVNDSYGHQAGDTVLKRIADILTGQIRKGDIVGRYGGEEFGIVVSCGSEEEVGILAERLRERVEKHQFETPRGVVSVTVSIGGKTVRDPSSTPEDLVRLADEALYLAKETGRNRVVLR